MSNQTISFWYTETIATYIYVYITFIGTVLKIDHELYSSLKKNDSKKKKKMNKNAQHVTPTKLAKLLKIYAPYLILRRTHWDRVEKKFVSEPEILFCSNVFTPGKLLFIIMSYLTGDIFLNLFSQLFSYSSGI
jgi:hypothetical protein